MSFEGYHQVLCENGHYDQVDIWSFIDLENFKCEKCEAKGAWQNLVNLTNGSFENHPITGEETRIDGYVELEIDKQEVCPTCKQTISLTYKIPKRRE